MGRPLQMDFDRAVATHLARRFGYSATEVAHALGYRSHGSVSNALARVESGGRNMLQTIELLYERLC